MLQSLPEAATNCLNQLLNIDPVIATPDDDDANAGADGGKGCRAKAWCNADTADNTLLCDRSLRSNVRLWS